MTHARDPIFNLNMNYPVIIYEVIILLHFAK